MTNNRFKLERLSVPIGIAVRLGLGFCLGLYYLFGSVIEALLAVKSNQGQREVYVFYTAWFFLTSALFFATIWSLAKKNKNSILYTSAALVSACAAVFNSFKEWVTQGYSKAYSEWIIVAACIGVLCFLELGGVFIRRKSGPNGGRPADVACACLITIVLADITFNGVLVAIAPLVSAFFRFAVYLGSSLVFLAIAMAYSGITTSDSVAHRFGFKTPSPQNGINAILLGSGIALPNLLAAKFGLLNPHNQLAASFHGGSFWYFQLLAVLSPFSEEIILRGYIFRAFRANYSLSTSICFMLLIAASLHLSVVWSAPLGGSALLGLNFAASMLMEKTGNVWNCICCHLAYNLVCLIG